MPYLISKENFIYPVPPLVGDDPIPMPLEKVLLYHSFYVERKDKVTDPKATILFDRDLQQSSFEIKNDLGDFLNNGQDEDFIVFRFLAKSTTYNYSELNVTPCLMKRGDSTISRYSNVMGPSDNPHSNSNGSTTMYFNERAMKAHGIHTFDKEIAGVAHKLGPVKKLWKDEGHPKYLHVIFILNYRDSELKTNVVFFFSNGSSFDIHELNNYHISDPDKILEEYYDNGTSCCPVP